MADLIAVTRRFKDLVLKYTTDFNEDTLVKQRVYRLEDVGQPINIQTVITPLILARVQDNENPSTIPKFKGEPRYVEACIPVPLIGRVLELRTIVPYNPSDVFHKLNVFEILSFPGVKSGKYFAENQSPVNG